MKLRGKKLRFFQLFHSFLEVKLIAMKYHQIMYDKNKNKIVPYAILNASKEIQKWFFEGYYTGDGYKPDKDCIIPKNGSVRMDCKGKIKRKFINS
mgnify:CR=1 FL=1